MVNWIRDGLSRAWHRKGSVFVLYLVATIPALGWALAAASGVGEALNYRPEAAGLLGDDRWLTFAELGANDGLALALEAVPLLLLLSWFAQVAAAAGYVPGLLRGKGAPAATFGEGVQRYTGRFLRASLAFLVCVAGLLAVCGLILAAGRHHADATRSELWSLRGALGALVVGVAFFVPLDLAYDLSRISAVAHGGRQTFRGFFRSLRWVVVRPGRLLPFYLALSILFAVGVGLFYWFGVSWAPVSVAGIALVFVARQLILLVRAYLKVSTWGAEAACYEDLADLDWCRGHRSPPPVGESSEDSLGSPPPSPSSPASSGMASLAAARNPALASSSALAPDPAGLPATGASLSGEDPGSGEVPFLAEEGEGLAGEPVLTSESIGSEAALEGPPVASQEPELETWDEAFGTDREEPQATERDPDPDPDPGPDSGKTEPRR